MKKKKEQDAQSKRKKGEAVPWLWLNENEHEGKADKCGCCLVRDYNNGGPAFFMCPKHEAGPDLLAALTDLLDSGLVGFGPKLLKGRAAIAKARAE